MVDHRSYTLTLSSCEIKTWKNSGDLRDVDAVLYQLSYQANWELVILWVGNIPVDSEECKWIYSLGSVWYLSDKVVGKVIFYIFSSWWLLFRFIQGCHMGRPCVFQCWLVWGSQSYGSWQSSPNDDVRALSGHLLLSFWGEFFKLEFSLHFYDWSFLKCSFCRMRHVKKMSYYRSCYLFS